MGSLTMSRARASQAAEIGNLGSGLGKAMSCDIVSGARRATEKGDFVARPRWQGGWLFKRGKRRPVWVGRFREDFLTEDGQRKRRERSVVLGLCREVGKREALRRLAERLAAINQGTRKPEMAISFEKFVLERWEPNIYPTLRLSTERNYRMLVRVHLLPFFGTKQVPEITPMEVQMFLSQKSKSLAPRTVLSLRNRLLKIFGDAIRWGYIEKNPAQGARIPALEDVRGRRTLRPEEARRLLSELSEPVHTMVLLALLSGLRRGEIFGLRWKAVSFEDSSILVLESNFEGRAVPVKTRASRRKVFVSQIVMDALRALRPQQFQPDDFVFAGENGKPLQQSNVLKRVLNPACERAGLPHVGWHVFRYTYSTWAEPTGESIKALQSQLGHTDSRLTLGVYTQPMPEAQKKIANKTAEVLLPIAPKLGVEPKPVSRVIQ